jgi:hypothetical protein
MRRIWTIRLIAPLLLTVSLGSVRDFAYGLATYQSSSELKALPDAEPHVTELGRINTVEITAVDEAGNRSPPVTQVYDMR